MSTKYFAPKDILVNMANRGRHYNPDKKAVGEMVLSLSSVGQISDITVRETDAGPELVAGYTRHEAGCVIQETTNPDFKLRCNVVKLSDEEAFALATAENFDRNETNPVDDAFNHQIFRDRFQWEDKRIAQHYKCSAARVSDLKKLLTLDEATLRKVAKGDLSVASAKILTDVTTAADRKAILDDATDSTGRVNGADILKNVRQWMADNPDKVKAAKSNKREKAAKDEASAKTADENAPQANGQATGDAPAGTPAPTPATNGATREAKAKPLTMAEFKEWLKGVRDGEMENACMIEFAQSTLEFLTGRDPTGETYDRELRQILHHRKPRLKPSDKGNAPAEPAAAQ